MTYNVALKNYKGKRKINSYVPKETLSGIKMKKTRSSKCSDNKHWVLSTTLRNSNLYHRVWM